MVFITDEEDVLWKTGTLGTGSPSSLVNAVFYNNGKILCLRGGEEHRKLKISQFQFDSDEGGEYVVFTENGSKNSSGSYKDKADNKIVHLLMWQALGLKSESWEREHLGAW